jgi:hypothetical protein
MQTQIAAILREAADRIASIVEPAPVVPTPPAGYHLPALGPVKGYALAESGDIQMWLTGTDEWSRRADGDSPRYYYAIRKGSKLAVLNGLEPAPAPEPDQPRFKVGDTVRVVSLEKAEPRFCVNHRMHKVGDTFVVSAVLPSSVVGPHRYVYDAEDLELVTAKPTPNQEQVDELVAAAWEAFEYADSKDLVLGRLACALRPFAK